LGLALFSVVFVTCIELRLESECRKVVVQDVLLLGFQLREQLLLVDYCLLSLLKCALNSAVHPVRIVAGWFNVTVFEFLLNVLPYLSVFKIGIKLNNLHVLLLAWFELMQVKTDSEEGSKNTCPDIVSFD